MTEVPYRPCKSLLSHEAEQSTDHGQRWARTPSKEEQWHDAWVSFVLAKYLPDPSTAVSTQNTEEEVDCMRNIGGRPRCHPCAAVAQHIGCLENSAADSGSNLERSIIGIVGHTQ